ncbi:MAG TPA: glycosyltransferase family 4 protein [Vicinamibacterales bacterium]|nr:glycosyltransferase family 4 protein [Vicinamibacterales bacterium]
MKIAEVAPLIESVPPTLYGGTERVVSYLTDELVAQGHDVTLFASGDSRTTARLFPVCARSLRLDRDCRDQLAWHVLMTEHVAAMADEFDVIHFHIAPIHFPLARRLGVPYVTTLHGRLDLPELVPLFAEFDDAPVISISDAQRAPLPHANWLGTIYHGLPETFFDFHPRGGDYLAFLGRVSPEKRVDRAIAIAVAVGWPLKIAAKVDTVDVDYFDREIRPLLDHPLVEFIGEIGEAAKNSFLGNARALLFPIDWPEPFGLVMIESLACGTPVVAFRGGSVEEVLDDGETGFIVDGLDEAIEATRRIGTIDRRGCRSTFEKRFSARRMAMDHVAHYMRAIEASAGRAAAV